MVFVAPNIFANEQNRSKRCRCSTNFTLGPGVICIYIESIRFWFIIVAVLGWGRGTGGGWQAFCHLLWGPCPWTSLGEGKQAIITVPGLKRRCSLPSYNVLNQGRRKWNSGGHRARLCSRARGDFQEGKKGRRKRKITENEINLSAQHWSCGDYSLSLTLINPHVPVFALSVCSGRANYIQAEWEEMHCRWSHGKWLFCPVMEIWIIIECLYSDVCTWYESQWVFCQRTDELCCFHFSLSTCI